MSAGDLQQQLLELYGPMLGGTQLVSVMGFKTSAAFHKAHRSGHLGVKVFSIPGRRGKFCMTSEVACWMQALSSPESGTVIARSANT